MKLFFKNIALFIIFFLLLAFMFQSIISLKIKGKSIRVRDNLEQTANINAKMIFLGASRCWSIFSTDFFDSAFKTKSINLGIDGHTEIIMATIRLKDYLSRNNNPPKVVVLSFDPFSQPGGEGCDIIYKNDYARYAFFPKDKDSFFVNFFQFNFVEKYIPLYSIFKYQTLGDCLSLKKNPTYTNGILNETWDTISRPINQEGKKSYFREDEVAAVTASLNDLKELCGKNNITLICIQTPVYKVLQDDSAFLRTGKICQSLGIPFFNTNKEYIRNNVNYFYNVNHLNLNGIGHMNADLLKDTAFTSLLKARLN